MDSPPQASESNDPMTASSGCFGADEEDGDQEDEGESEDITDEAVTRRHEHVLRTMRERWALLQKLKQEQKELHSAASGGGAQGRSTPGSGHSVHSSGSGGHFFSPKKHLSVAGHRNTGSNPRKRGRPPKNVKADPSQVLFSTQQSESSAATTPRGTNYIGSMTNNTTDSDGEEDDMDEDEDEDYNVGLEYAASNKVSTPIMKSPPGNSIPMTRSSAKLAPSHSSDSLSAPPGSASKSNSSTRRTSSRLSPTPPNIGRIAASMTSPGHVHTRREGSE